jgi:pyrroloquinoline-quinone synthase
MTTQEFFHQLDACIAKYDLLSHPFYRAWSCGQLSREDLREYAFAYYPHVKAFPGYLAAFATRLEDGALRKTVLANMQDEIGETVAGGESQGSHAELWLDFAEGVGACRNGYFPKPVPEIEELLAHFTRIASTGTPGEALAAFYAYESQVPRIAIAKEKGLRENYAADDRTRGYFTLHATADVYHSRAWKHELQEIVDGAPQAQQDALAAAESTAQALWRALDGIEQRRRLRAA